MSAGSISKVRAPHWLLATACLGVALGAELVSVQPLKLPGHRALPAVLALLVFGRSLPAPVALGYAVVTPLVVTCATPARASVGVGALWVAGAALAVVMGRRGRAAPSHLLLFGAGFGALRAVLAGGPHGGTLAQLLGNVMFGALGALVAVALLQSVEK